MNLFHVTFASSVSQILRSGIRTGKSPVWFKKGAGLFLPGFIFAFTDYREAAKWALKQSHHTSKSTVIVTFISEPSHWTEDEHPEGVLECFGAWIKSDRAVLPGSILRVCCQPQWAGQIDPAQPFAPTAEKTTVWKWFHTHLSGLSELLICVGDDRPKR